VANTNQGERENSPQNDVIYLKYTKRQLSFQVFSNLAPAPVPLKNFRVGMPLFWGTMWED
jgi:hypothetical protein